MKLFRIISLLLCMRSADSTNRTEGALKILNKNAVIAAQLIHLIQRVERVGNTSKFSEAPIQNENKTISYESMKLLQKNYDTNKAIEEYNVMNRTRLHLIRNPEVLDRYREGVSRRNMEYAGTSDQDTRSYIEEAMLSGKLRMHNLKPNSDNRKFYKQIENAKEEVQDESGSEVVEDYDVKWNTALREDDGEAFPVRVTDENIVGIYNNDKTKDNSDSNNDNGENNNNNNDNTENDNSNSDNVEDNNSKENPSSYSNDNTKLDNINDVTTDSNSDIDINGDNIQRYINDANIEEHSTSNFVSGDISNIANKNLEIKLNKIHENNNYMIEGQIKKTDKKIPKEPGIEIDSKIHEEVLDAQYSNYHEERVISSDKSIELPNKDNPVHVNKVLHMNNLRGIVTAKGTEDEIHNSNRNIIPPDNKFSKKHKAKSKKNISIIETGKFKDRYSRENINNNKYRDADISKKRTDIILNHKAIDNDNTVIKGNIFLNENNYKKLGKREKSKRWFYKSSSKEENIWNKKEKHDTDKKEFQYAYNVDSYEKSNSKRKSENDELINVNDESNAYNDLIFMKIGKKGNDMPRKDIWFKKPKTSSKFRDVMKKFDNLNHKVEIVDKKTQSNDGDKNRDYFNKKLNWNISDSHRSNKGFDWNNKNIDSSKKDVKWNKDHIYSNKKDIDRNKKDYNVNSKEIYWKKQDIDFNKKDTNLKKQDTDWNKKDSDLTKKDSQWNKPETDWNKSNRDLNQKDADWNDKGVDWTKKDSKWKKKDIVWNKKDIYRDKNSNEWNKKDTDWNEKDSDWNKKYTDRNRETDYKKDSDWEKKDNDWKKKDASGNKKSASWNKQNNDGNKNVFKWGDINLEKNVKKDNRPDNQDILRDMTQKDGSHSDLEDKIPKYNKFDNFNNQHANYGSGNRFKKQEFKFDMGQAAAMDKRPNKLKENWNSYVDQMTDTKKDRPRNHNIHSEHKESKFSKAFGRTPIPFLKKKSIYAK